MLRLAVIFLVISLVAGAFGFINVSEVTRRISFVVDAVSAPALATLLD